MSMYVCFYFSFSLGVCECHVVRLLIARRDFHSAQCDWSEKKLEKCHSSSARFTHCHAIVVRFILVSMRATRLFCTMLYASFFSLSLDSRCFFLSFFSKVYFIFVVTCLCHAMSSVSTKHQPFAHTTIAVSYTPSYFNEN